MTRLSTWRFCEIARETWKIAIICDNRVHYNSGNGITWRMVFRVLLILIAISVSWWEWKRPYSSPANGLLGGEQIFHARWSLRSRHRQFFNSKHDKTKVKSRDRLENVEELFSRDSPESVDTVALTVLCVVCVCVCIYVRVTREIAHTRARLESGSRDRSEILEFIQPRTILYRVEYCGCIVSYCKIFVREAIQKCE